MTQVIYKIVNLVNDKFYVGSTINKKVRFRQHRKLLRGNRHHCKHLQAAWNKYGENKFDFQIIEEVPEALSLQEVEDRYLQEHVGKPYCYNSGYASEAPWRGAPAHVTPNFGKTWSPEQRNQISATLKEFYAADYANHPRVGTTHTEETKARISATKKANPVRPWLGKTRSEETKTKIGAAQRGKAKGPRTYTPEGLAKVQEVMRQNARPMPPLSIEEVLAKFPPEVLVSYDFSKAIYTGALNRITGCLCPIHGDFSQYAAQFRKGRGCPSCGGDKRAESKRQQMKEAWATPEGRELFLQNRKPLASSS